MADANSDDEREVSRQRQIISGTNAVVVVLATIGIAFLANAIVSQVTRFRLDLTENNLYTLSEASKEVVGDMEEPVTVKAFISANLPKPHHRLRQRVRDMLTEYRAASGGQLDFQIYSPGGEGMSDKESKRIEEDAKGYGCEKVGIGQQGEDRVSLRAVYKCVAFIKGGGQQTEVIKDLKMQGGRGQASGNFEYKFTKTLMNLQDREPRKVGFVSGFGGPAGQRGFSRQIKPVFENLFGDLVKPTTVDLSTKSSVPDDISALVLLNPSKKVSDKAKWAIDQFLQNGGSVGWYQSSTGPNKKMQQRMRRKMGRNARLPQFRKALEPGLRSFFADYGLQLRKDLVLDRENAMVGMVRTRRGMAAVSFPGTFTTTNIDRTLPFTRDFSTLAFPVPSSVKVKAKARDAENLRVHKVVQSEDTSIRWKGIQTDLQYETLQETKDDAEKGPFVLAAALQGDLPSYYADREPPKGVSSGDSGQDDASTKPGRLFIVGSGNFYRPQQGLAYKRRLASLGGQFFISSIEWLVQDSALAQIRGKSMPRLIDEVPTEKKRGIQFVNIAFVPALFALIGVGMMYRRRRRRRNLRWDDSES